MLKNEFWRDRDYSKIFLSLLEFINFFIKYCSYGSLTFIAIFFGIVNLITAIALILSMVFLKYSTLNFNFLDISLIFLTFVFYFINLFFFKNRHYLFSKEELNKNKKLFFSFLTISSFFIFLLFIIYSANKLINYLIYQSWFLKIINFFLVLPLYGFYKLLFSPPKFNRQ